MICRAFLGAIILFALGSLATGDEPPKDTSTPGNVVRVRILGDKGKPLPHSTVRIDGGNPIETDDNAEAVIPLSGERLSLNVAPSQSESRKYVGEVFEIPSTVVELTLQIRVANNVPTPPSDAVQVTFRETLPVICCCYSTKRHSPLRRILCRCSDVLTVSSLLQAWR